MSDDYVTWHVQTMCGSTDKPMMNYVINDWCWKLEHVKSCVHDQLQRIANIVKQQLECQPMWTKCKVCCLLNYIPAMKTKGLTLIVTVNTIQHGRVKTQDYHCGTHGWNNPSWQNLELFHSVVCESSNKILPEKPTISQLLHIVK